MVRLVRVHKPLVNSMEGVKRGGRGVNKNEIEMLAVKLAEAKKIISSAGKISFNDLAWREKGWIFDLFCPALEAKRYGYGDSYSASEGFF